MKKILSLVLAVLMVVSLVPAVFAAPATGTNKDSAYAKAIDFLAAVGFYKGGAGVADDDDISRWQMALFVDRLVTGEVEDSYWATTENDSGFTDLGDLEDYMVGAVTFAAQEGIINGYGDGTFGPNDGITYRDALVMTVRALGTKYSASGYPWSYIATARELGLMDGITGIGWTDEITREVVAQIMYNAFFATVKGTTIAEKVFNIGYETVMITASNRVVYKAAGTKVVASGYVRLSVVDEQLEPAGTEYHIQGSVLGLNDKLAQNDAVGTLYNVWYKNDFNSIVMYEDLNTLYQNRPGKKEVSFSDSPIKRCLVVNGKATRMVYSFTNLYNQDRPTSATGTPESKMYYIGKGTNNNSGANIRGTTYVMYPDGWIYAIATLAPVGYYSEYLDAWYTYNATTKTYAAMATTDPIYKDLHSGVQDGAAVAGFGSAVDTANNWTDGFSGYLDLIASDVDQDGFIDRAIAKQYRIGWYTETVSSNKTYFTITGGYDTSAPDLRASTWVNNKNAKAAVSGALKSDYEITGSPAKDSFIVYYLDTDNKQLDVVKTIGQKSATTTDTYWSYGYILGFFQTQNKIYIDDGESRAPLDLGYNDMLVFGSPLYQFGTRPGYVSAIAGDVGKTSDSMLVDKLLPFVEEETYVKYFVLDGKVICIEKATPNSGDYVIIDSYADISADGIKVNAWSTVTDQYDVITLAEFNGWDIDGVEWDALWQTAIYQAFATGKMPSMNDLLAKYIPIEFGRVYAVVSSDADKNYNITTKLGTGIPQTDVDVVVAGGYVHSYNANHTNYVTIANVGSAGVLETSGTDFWLVKEILTDAAGNPTDEYKVYGRVGKLANVIFGDLNAAGLGVTVYKADAKSRDFVIEGTTDALAQFLAQIDLVDDSKIQYAVYEGTNLNQSQEDFEYNAGTYFRQTFRDVITGSYFVVDFDTAKETELLNAVKANRTAGKYNTIYKIVDGKLLSAEAIDMAEVAAYVWAQKSYTKQTAVTGDAVTVTALLNSAVSALEVAVLNNTITNAQADERVYISPANVTFVVLDADKDDAIYGIRYSSTVDKIGTAAFANVATDSLANAKAYIFYNDAATVSATKAIVYIDYGTPVDTLADVAAKVTFEGALLTTDPVDADITVSFKDNIENAPLVITMANFSKYGDWFAANATKVTVKVNGVAATATVVGDATNKTLTIEVAAPITTGTYVITVDDSASSDYVYDFTIEI